MTSKRESNIPNKLNTGSRFERNGFFVFRSAGAEARFAPLFSVFENRGANLHP
jgi:hypothetical protein